jgi:D-3-phosphoglycerate dehydrogenase
MKALLLENIHPDADKIVAASGLEPVTAKGSLGADELLAALDGVALLGIRSNTKVTREVIEAAPPTLQAIGAFCIGTNQIDLAAASRKGIAVFNAPYSNTRSVVELAMGEIVALSRKVIERNADAQSGVWRKSADGSHEVRGRTIGIVGYGNIGSQLSVLAEAFGLRVVYYDIVDKLALGNAKRCDTLDELLAEADIVTLHVDGRPGNAGLFGEPQFAAMRDGAIFLNLSRGFVVDTAALAKHLKAGHLGGAGVDVFPVEPKVAGDPFVDDLQGLPNTILTPHIGGSTQEAQVDIGHFVATKLTDYLATGSTVMSVNLPEVQPAEQEGKRVLHVHQNVPGVLASLNRILASHNANVAFQSLATRGEVGYAITDVTSADPGIGAELESLPETIRVRVL